MFFTLHEDALSDVLLFDDIDAFSKHFTPSEYLIISHLTDKIKENISRNVELDCPKVRELVQELPVLLGRLNYSQNDLVVSIGAGAKKVFRCMSGEIESFKPNVYMPISRKKLDTFNYAGFWDYSSGTPFDRSPAIESVKGMLKNEKYGRIIFFDDWITSGNTMNYLIDLLNESGKEKIGLALLSTINYKRECEKREDDGNVRGASATLVCRHYKKTKMRTFSFSNLYIWSKTEEGFVKRFSDVVGVAPDAVEPYLVEGGSILLKAKQYLEPNIVLY